MSKKDGFYGKYYKFVSAFGYSFAMIVAHSNEGESIQIITNTRSYLLDRPKDIHIESDKYFSFDVAQDDLSIKGELFIDELHPLKKHVMGPFHYVPMMECKHQIYSMFHNVSGSLTINDELISFENGYGYIEGDSGVNFPSKYVWYNSSKKDVGVTFAIASIPFGLFSFTGILCFIKTKDREYYLSTYNFSKAVCIEEDHIVIKRGNYLFEVFVDEGMGHKLKAPVKGDMVRYIKENVSISSRYRLLYKGKIVIENKDPNSSYEWVWKD